MAQKLQGIYNETIMTNRTKRFMQLCLKLTPPAKAVQTQAIAKAKFADIALRYGEPQRHYHTMNHVVAALKEFDAIRDRLADPDTVEMAIWLHDVIYDPKRNDNETASAAYAKELLMSLGCTARTTARVANLIIATTHAHDARLTPDAKYTVDIDLSSLAVPWKTFAKNGTDLRKENAHLSDTAHTNGQIAFLGSMLARKHIYATQFFRDRYEARARANIAKTLGLPDKTRLYK